MKPEPSGRDTEAGFVGEAACLATQALTDAATKDSSAAVEGRVACVYVGLFNTPEGTFRAWTEVCSLTRETGLLRAEPELGDLLSRSFNWLRLSI